MVGHILWHELRRSNHCAPIKYQENAVTGVRFLIAKVADHHSPSFTISVLHLFCCRNQLFLGRDPMAVSVPPTIPTDKVCCSCCNLPRGKRANITMENIGTSIFFNG